MRQSYSNSHRQMMRRRGLRGLGVVATTTNGALMINPATGSPLVYTVSDPTGLKAHYQDNTVLLVSPSTTDPIQSPPPPLDPDSNPQLTPAFLGPPTAITPSGTQVSTQTGQTVTLANITSVVPGVFLCTMSDGSQRYCNSSGVGISYTPPPVPVTTPAAGSQTPVATTPAAVTPAGTPISTTTGTPTSSTVVSTVENSLSSLMTWLEGSLIGGIPNWLLVGGAVAGLMMFGGDGGSHRRR